MSDSFIGKILLVDSKLNVDVWYQSEDYDLEEMAMSMANPCSSYDPDTGKTLRVESPKIVMAHYYTEVEE